MKKLILTLTLVAASFASAHAEWALKVSLADGSEPTYVLAEKPAITFEGQNMVIKTSDASTEYPRADVINMTFTSEVSSVEDITNTSSILSYVGGVVVAPDTDIMVYDLNGRMCISGHGEVSLDQLPAGIYIVATPYQTLKVIK